MLTRLVRRGICASAAATVVGIVVACSSAQNLVSGTAEGGAQFSFTGTAPYSFDAQADYLFFDTNDVLANTAWPVTVLVMSEGGTCDAPEAHISGRSLVAVLNIVDAVTKPVGAFTVVSPHSLTTANQYERVSDADGGMGYVTTEAVVWLTGAGPVCPLDLAGAEHVATGGLLVLNEIESSGGQNGSLGGRASLVFAEGTLNGQWGGLTCTYPIDVCGGDAGP